MTQKLEEGLVVDVLCPRCKPQAKLIVHTNRFSGRQLLVCPNYPACTYAQGIPTALLEKETIPLPGFSAGH